MCTTTLMLLLSRAHRWFQSKSVKITTHRWNHTMHVLKAARCRIPHPMSRDRKTWKYQNRNEPVVEEVACSFDWANVCTMADSERHATPSGVRLRLLIWGVDNVCGRNQTSRPVGQSHSSAGDLRSRTHSRPQKTEKHIYGTLLIIRMLFRSFVSDVLCCRTGSC